MDLFNYRRRKTSVTRIGNKPIGDGYPIRVQSMANVSTMDTVPAAEQAIRMIEAGAEFVRFTTQGEREARNMVNIKDYLTNEGYLTPLVADVHFNPKVADVAATIVEKVRINPGNYVDKVKTFSSYEYTDKEYAEELEKLRRRFVPFLDICKEHNTAIRIGVNHGSLSDRITSRYGDTPAGMVASCMEFLRICVEEHFFNVVLSIKASNTVVMVQTVRLLVETMEAEEMHFPLHLGVTEAGDGEDGRIKSAVGIGTLLADGIGDTIRVSLSEEPEAEMPVASKLVHYINEREGHAPIVAKLSETYVFLSPERRKSDQIAQIGGDQPPIVISDRSRGDFAFDSDFFPDYIYIGKEDPENLPDNLPLIIDAHFWKEGANRYPCFLASELEELKLHASPLKFLRLSYPDLNDKLLETLKQRSDTVVILSTYHRNSVGSQRAAMHAFMIANCSLPVVLHREYHEKQEESLQVKAGADLGALLLDGFSDGIMLSNDQTDASVTDRCMFGILQATRTRISKTEYISCPGCGRTLFNLQATIARVKEATSHLKGLKIGIMGCIVNGPGEMADADYGYVGAGRDRISLYKGKQCILKNIPEEEAVERLVQLIKEN
ncbi:4-hydroxy-3-methylbut-2-en-1-yl diphosphate synthase, partial [Parabacteroides sp. OttesenSCG-928-N08]|nr:4-hydroxy-3-methylbut-2-en-1-yl diphosphate synthase [Parabacteroides sp. OttesenSCG-928-N08]